MRETQDFPDKTVDELLEQDEDDKHSISDEELEDMLEEMKGLREGAVLHLQAAALAEMFFDGELTLRRYVEMVDWIEERADEKGVDLP